MNETKSLLLTDIFPDASQPRRHFSESELLGLGQNMLTFGQHFHIIVFTASPAEDVIQKYILCDGERRYRAAMLVGMSALNAIILAVKPTTAELALIRASIDIHRASLRLTERSDLICGIQKETGKPVTELARMLSISQSYASKLLSLQRLEPSIKLQLDEGTLKLEDAYSISQQPDAKKQLELAADAGRLSHRELSQKAKGKVTHAAPALSNIRLAMPGGYQISVQGKDITFDLAIEVLGETVRMLKKGRAQGLSLASQMKVMKDTAKAPRAEQRRAS